MYIQDDWKVNRNITINLGIRNEYETAVARSESFPFARSRHKFDRPDDCRQSAANAGRRSTDIVGPNYTSFAGQWNFTSPSQSRNVECAQAEPAATTWHCVPH